MRVSSSSPRHSDVLPTVGVGLLVGLTQLIRRLARPARAFPAARADPPPHRPLCHSQARGCQAYVLRSQGLPASRSWRSRVTVAWRALGSTLPGMAVPPTEPAPEPTHWAQPRSRRALTPSGSYRRTTDSWRARLTRTSDGTPSSLGSSAAAKISSPSQRSSDTPACKP